MSVVIHHNPDCGTSRNVLAIIKASGVVPAVIPYLDTGWTRGQLLGLFAAAGLTPRSALRISAELRQRHWGCWILTWGTKPFWQPCWNTPFWSIAPLSAHPKASGCAAQARPCWTCLTTSHRGR